MNDPNAPGGQQPEQPPAPQSPPPPPPQAQQGWQSTPQQPGPPPMGGGQPGGGMPSWTNNITASNTLPGPGGTALATIGNRIVAIIIDAVILAVINFILAAVLGSFLYQEQVVGGVLGIPVTVRSISIVGILVLVVLAVIINAAYFIFMWSRMNGATLGMQVMKLRVVDASTGGPITQQQAINRWLLLGGPQALNSLYVWGAIGLLISLAVLVYYIYLLVTTAQSPTRQGLHDTYAKTAVIKVA